MPFIVLYEPPDHVPGGEPVSVTISTAYEVRCEVARRGRGNQKIVDITGRALTVKKIEVMGDRR